MADEPIDLEQAADAALEHLKEKMGNDAVVVVKQLFDKLNDYVDEDCGPALAVAGVSTNSARFNFLRMIIVRAFRYALTSAWGPTKKEQEFAMEFAKATLGHFGGALGDVVGEPCRIGVVWGDDDEEDEAGPKLVVPG